MHRRIVLSVIAVLMMGAMVSLWWNRVPKTADEAISAWRESVDPDCPITPATQEDIDAAKALGAEVFDPGEGQMEVSEHPGFVLVRWTRDDERVSIYSYYVLLDCDYTYWDMDAFLSDKNLDLMFASDDSLLHGECGRRDLELRHYERDDQVSILWIESEGLTRARITRLDTTDWGTIPQFDQWDQWVYPEFVRCTK